MKRTLCAILSAVFLSMLAIPCAAADTAAPLLAAERTYTPFSDIPAGAWYADAVKLCYETGVFNGTSDTAFSPQAGLTNAQLEVLAARVKWRLEGNTGDLPAVAADTGAVSITLPDGTVYDAASFVQVNNTGLGGAAIPRGDFIITLAGDYLDGKSPAYVTVTVDGSLTFRANQDRANSYDPLFYMYRYHIQEADYGAHDPMVRINTFSDSDGASAGAWYWSGDCYLRILPGAMDAALPDTLTEQATRYDAAAVMALIAGEDLLAPLSSAVPADTDRADVTALYQAGILTGTDDQGTFNGKGTLTRAQFAVILARLLDPAQRVSAEG
ncbi:S-layer homology domain-containing protein [Dysosmobacter sp.]|uniref:S-layer homology domain-containing protein n=1 Tax=Dysosmobacter sp. TaxID=2591382 RepID=UPI002A93DB2A|nr:S-layer homology domain-containing protein [Dysosmobacter sp.]MCI6053908.1 S-layer homology domain-containing protein [Dysosmobacter sp.]MDY5511351.1 S-layer homology domain-containing protein [Dysosmobacter sp.]